MVGVPLPHPHSKRVDILVELIEERDTLDDHVVGPVDVKLDLAPGVSVAETQLGLSRCFRCKRLDHLVEVEPDAANDLGNDSDMADLDAEDLGNGGSELRVEDSQDDLLQLLGKIGLEEVFQLQ